MEVAVKVRSCHGPCNNLKSLLTEKPKRWGGGGFGTVQVCSFFKSCPENIMTVSIISTLSPRLPQKCDKKPMDLLDNIVFHRHHHPNTFFTQFPG